MEKNERKWGRSTRERKRNRKKINSSSSYKRENYLYFTVNSHAKAFDWL